MVNKTIVAGSRQFTLRFNDEMEINVLSLGLIREVRKRIDIMEPSELADWVIQAAITDSDVLVDAYIQGSSAPANLITVAKVRYAAYLSYKAYCDRAKHIIPGAVDTESGVFKPRSRILVRVTEAKLADLKKLADDIIGLIINYDSSGTVIVPELAQSSEVYPDVFKYNDLDDVSWIEDETDTTTTTPEW